MSLRTQIVEAARSYLGVSYLHQGRNRFGIDCVGLLAAVCSDLSLPVLAADRYDYTPTGDGVELMSQLQMSGFVKTEVMTYGTVVGFWVGSTTRLRHVGIVAPENRLIHVHQGVGKVVEHSFGNWLRRAKLCWDFPGVQ